MKGHESNGMDQRRLPAMAGACLMGALGGSLACAKLPALREWMLNWSGGPAGLWQAAWPALALLGGAMASAFLRAGLITGLLALAAEGGLLAAEATALTVELGKAGYACGLARCFLPGFLSLAAMILLSRQSLGWAALRLSRPPGRGRRAGPDGAFFLTAAICAGLTLLGAAARLWISPRLWQAMQTFFPAA